MPLRLLHTVRNTGASSQALSCDLGKNSPSPAALCLSTSILSCSNSAISTESPRTILLTNYGGTTGSASPKMNGVVSSTLLLVSLRLPHSAGNTPGGDPGELLKVPRSNCLTSSGSSGAPSLPPTNDNTTMTWVACHSPFHTYYYWQSTTSNPYLLTQKTNKTFFFCLLPTNSRAAALA